MLAAVLSFGLLLLSYFSTSLAAIIPSDPVSSLIGVAIVICLLAVLIYIMTKNLLLAAGVGLGLEAVLAVVFLLRRSLLQGLINRIIAVLGMPDRLNNLVYGELDLTVVVYYLSVIFLFLFLSVQAIYKRRWS